MKKRLVTSLAAAAVLGLAGAGTAQAAGAPAAPSDRPAAVAAGSAAAAGSALPETPSADGPAVLPELSSLPGLILREVVAAGRLIHDWA
ncbi:hypothetical protein ACIF8T_07940 [Streptomyces sp. NPDC085946]|uniref:hypothetical protein n=1 Tax=Streptomyces sp. NPDC085946 TaxID=3365744 RepID=UPI0037CF1BCD